MPEVQEKFEAFINGQVKKLICKPKIGAWGLNLQHCAHVVSYLSHSFEQYYQTIRRCWRFGQKRKVRHDLVTTEGESDVMLNLHRKQKQADRMFSEIVANMNAELHIERWHPYEGAAALPSWLTTL